LLFGINLFTHIFIDAFNGYGVGWFEPFSSYRVSFHVLFVADPLFSIWPFIAFLALIFTSVHHKRRNAWRVFGISFSILYLCFALTGKIIVNTAVRRNLAEMGVQNDKYITTPTPFNSLLWFVAAKDKDGYQVGYRSIFDSQKKMDFTYFPQNDYLLDQVKNREEVEDLRVFANYFYTVDKRNDTIIFSVLRFGQVVGWHDPKEKFAFYFYMDKPGSNELMTQRGRFERWNSHTISSFFRRMKGN
jgi:inner membrane protein